MNYFTGMSRGIAHGAAPKPRGEDTRRRLIDAAIDVFGELGFEGTSTRMLAERAGVNLAAIPYYFTGKEGLYRAAAEHIDSRVTEEMDQIIRAVAALGFDAPRETVVRLLHEFVDRFTALVVGSGEADNWSRFVMREQMQPGAGFEIFYRGCIQQSLSTCATLLARLFNQPASDIGVRARASALMGEMLTFRTNREAALRWLGWSDFNPRRLELIQRILKDHIDRIAGAQSH